MANRDGGELVVCRDLNFENQPIVRNFIPMMLCEGGQVGMSRIAFMGDMCRKAAGIWTQHTFCVHSVCVLKDLMGAQMVATRLMGAIGVIQDDNIESHLVLPEGLPCLFEQRGCIRTIK